MNRHQEIKVILERSQLHIKPRLWCLLLLLILAGFLTFIIGLLLGEATLVWQSLLVNFLFFSGLSIGGLMFSVIFTITNAVWGRPIKRLAEAMIGFLPIAAVLMVLLFFGAPYLYQWIDPSQVIQSKAGWLNFPFFIGRQVFLFCLFSILSWFYLKASLRPDIALAKNLIGFSNVFSEMFIRNFGDPASEEKHGLKISKLLAPYIAILFVIMSTLIAFDWIMSLDQEWFSTLFGLQYTMASLLSAAAALIIISGIARQTLNLEAYFTIRRHHDIGKLTFAACLIWTYLVFSQVLVIWYGNMPKETPYLLLRMQSLEWGYVSWIVLSLLFTVPLLGLMSRTACQSIWFSRLVAVEILIGLWLEKYLLIVPSVQENSLAGKVKNTRLPGLDVNLYDVFLTLGMLAIFLACFFWFLKRVPVLPIADRYLMEEEGIRHKGKGNREKGIGKRHKA